MPRLKQDRKPSLACELAAGHVVAARARDGQIDVSTVRTLASGALVPNLTATNIANRNLTRRAIEEAMAGVASRSRDVIAVLPDAACRVSLLDFDTLPDNREDADAVVRFRLKKSLPFDVDKARVSYHAQPFAGKVHVLAAVTLFTVLEEYESLLRETGYTPGIVMPSMIAALGQVDASVPTLVIKVDGVSTAVAIVNQGRVLLVRTLDNPQGARPDGQQLAEDVYPSLVFFQDTYGTKVEKILVGGLESLDSVNAALAESTGIRAQELVSAAYLGAGVASQRSALAGVVGALLS